MLSARYLAGCSDDLVKLYTRLESEIILDMAKRFKRLSLVTDSSVYQAQILKEVGGLQSDIYKIIAQYDKEAQKQIVALFNEAMKRATANDVKAFTEAKRELSENQLQVIKATAEKTSGVSVVNANTKTREDFAEGKAIKTFTGLQRITMTIADSVSADFVNEANIAYLKVTSGATDYNSALKTAVNNIAKKGATTVEYTDSGKTIYRTIESAVRTNIMSGINQTVSQITINNCADLGTDLVEVSAHLGARPEHEEWQGKIYSLSGTSDKYPPFSICGFGDALGICGINCRHSYYPYFEGMEPQYSDGQLDEMKDATVTFKGQELTQYEAEQRLRLYERAIRKWKRDAEALKEYGSDNTDALLKIGEWQKTAREFCKETGLRRDYAREYIGTPDGKQPKGIELEKILPF